MKVQAEGGFGSRQFSAGCLTARLNLDFNQFAGAETSRPACQFNFMSSFATRQSSPQKSHFSTKLFASTVFGAGHRTNI
jgi:hypothetical protein